MAKWVIVTESGSDISPADREKYGIKIVPMYVNIGNTSLKDGLFPVESIFENYRLSRQPARTSGAGIVDYTDIYNEIDKSNPGCNILHLGYSAVTTVSYNNALLASEDMENIVHIDTKQVCGGLRCVAVKMAEYLQKFPEASKEDVKKYAEQIICHSDFAFLPGQLEYLKAGGRVSNPAYMVATMLNLKPLIEMKDGRLTATKKYRGSDSKTYTKFLEDYLNRHKFEKDSFFMVYSPGIDMKLKEKLEAQANKHGYNDVTWVTCGGVISCHSGPGAFGAGGITIS